MNSKIDNTASTISSPRPQKPYKGQGERHRREILRAHLFSGRLMTLNKIYKINSRPLPLFESPRRQILVKVDYFGSQFDLILSQEDSWTATWMHKLRKFSKAMDYQFNFVSTAIGGIMGALGLTASLADMISTFMKTLTAATVSMFLAIGILIKSDDTFVKCQAMTIIITNLNLSMSTVASIGIPLVTGGLFFQSNEKPFSWVPSGIALLLALMMGGATSGQYLGIFERTTNMGYTMATIVGVHRILTDSIRELLPFVYEKITGKTWVLDQLKESLPKFTEFTTAVEDFEKKHLKDLETDWSAQEKVVKLQTKYRNLMEDATRLRLQGSLAPLVQNYYRKVEGWMKRVNASGILLGGQRQEPVSILIFGKPGGGKSFMVNKLVRDVGQESIPWGTIPDETIQNHIYTRNPQEQYWSGYRGQFCTLYDDFGQVSDTEGNPDPEFMEMIQAVGDNPYKIPMADIEEKNRGYFRSRLIIATTNLERISSTVVKSIRSPSALLRRFDMQVEVEKDAKGTTLYTLYLDGDAKEKIEYPELVNCIRAKLRMKVKKFDDRSEDGKKKESNIGPLCIAKRIAYVSGPCSTVDTMMRRTYYNARDPSHAYCDPLAQCRQTEQAFWNRTVNPDDLLERQFTMAQALVNTRLRSLLAPQAWQPAQVERWEDAKEQVNLLIEEKDKELAEWDDPRVAFPPGEDLQELIDADRPLFTQIFYCRVARTNIEAFDEAYEESEADLVPLGVIPVTNLILRYAKVIWERIKKVFAILGGIFNTMFMYVDSLTTTQQILVLTMVNMLPALIMSLVVLFTDSFSKKTVNETGNEDWIDTGMVTAFEAKIIESKLTRESRDMKGHQKPMKGRSMKMTKEAIEVGLKFPPEKLLETVEVGGNKFLIMNRDFMKHVIEEGSEDFTQALREMFMLYGELFIAATHGGNTSVKQYHIRMVSLIKRVSEQFHHTKVMEALDIEPQVSKIVHTKKMFEAWLEDYEPKMLFEGSSDQNADGIAKALIPNLWDIRPAGAINKASHIFFYEGRKAWCNKHTYERIKDRDFTISRTRKDGTEEELTFKWIDCKVVAHPDLDLVLIQFPKTMSPHQSMKKHIFSDANLNFKILPACRLVTRREGEIVMIQSPHPFLIEQASIECDTLIPACTSVGYNHMNTVIGDCGAPVLVMDPTRQQKIFGMHFLGNGFGSGQAVIITTDLLESMESYADFDKQLAYQHNFETFDGESHVKMPLGTIPTPFEPTKTKVRRSIIHGVVSEPITAPTILRVTDVCDPMERGLKELQGPKVIISNSFIEDAQQVLTRYTSGTPLVARTLTLEEALSGEGIEGLEPIELSTSAGLPLSMEPNAMGKRKWINDDRTPKPEFIKMMNDFISQIKHGDLQDIPIFKETLKDERVKKAKADINDPTKIKTRLFSASPLVLLVALRMYYGAFMAHAVRNEIRNTCTSGANPHGPDWHMITDWLHEVSTEVDDGDYSCFDTSQPSGLLIAVYTSIRSWYTRNGGTTEDDTIRDRLAELCYHPYRSARGVVYRTNGSLPSGMFGTTQINSGSNLVAFFYAFRFLFPESTAEDFLDNVRTVSHGDDVLFSVSPAFKEFTSENIGKALKHIGMTFTPADKSGVASKARAIEQTTFLKRGFKPICGIYRAPLDVNSSLEMCNWITKSADPVQATVDNCKAALRELAISEDDMVLQGKIRDAIYQATNGRVTLPLVTRMEAINSLAKHF